MAAHREQPPRQVLPADRVRPPTAGPASRTLEPGLVRRRERPGGRVTLLHRLASIVRWMVRRKRAERDLNDELEAFVDTAAADRMRGGATPAEARRLAVLDLGGV